MSRRPQRLGDVLSEVMARRGYAQLLKAADYSSAWSAAVGAALAAFSRPGHLRRGVLEITVSNSVLVQELTFQKQDLLARLIVSLPDEKITDLRFRVGRIA